MNGGWFWWGKKTGELGYRQLYRMLFERLTHFHKLNNLLWVFNANELRLNVDAYHKYYPGDDVVDILATMCTVVTGTISHCWRWLAKAHCVRRSGNIPVKLLRKQPRWTWLMYFCPSH
jgi:mannan endo-1,4-beta-mannosidase